MTAPRFRKNRCFTESTLRSFASFRMTSEGFSMTPHSKSLPGETVSQCHSEALAEESVLSKVLNT